MRKQIQDALEKQDVVTCSSLLQKHDGAFDKVFELVALGVRCDECDWETDYSNWPETLLPHIDGATELLSRIKDEQQRRRLREAWEALPDRPSVHSVAIKEHAKLIVWAKSHPGDLLQHIGGSFMSGGLAGYRINSEPPTFFEHFQGAVLVQSTDWQEFERLVSVNVEITKLRVARARTIARNTALVEPRWGSGWICFPNPGWRGCAADPGLRCLTASR